MGRVKSFLRRNWKKILADVLILGGLAALLYPVGTWAYTRFEQSGLRKELVQGHPALTAEVQSFFDEELVDVAVSVPVEHDAARQAEAKAEREALELAFYEAARAFATEVEGNTGQPIGRVVIPSIGVDVVMLEGVGNRDLRQGPGHWPETPFPGMGGNFVVSGHRTTYGAPFFKLNELEAGDEIDLVLPYAMAQYKVTRTLIVLPDETEVVAQRGQEEVSLVACHPIYSARQRIVVQGELVAFRLIEAESAKGGAAGGEVFPAGGG